MQRARGEASSGAAGSSSGSGTAAAGSPRPAPPERPNSRGSLPGSPALPFHARLTLRFCQHSLLVDALLLAAILTFVARMLPHAPPEARVWAMLYVAATATSMALAHACSWGLAQGWPPRSRALELLTLLVRTCDLGAGGVCAAMHASVVRHQTAAAAGGAHDGGAWAVAANAARFVYASGVCNQALLIGVLRLRPGLSAVAQLVMVRSILPLFRDFCQPGGALARPHLLRDARRLYAAVHWAMLGTASRIQRPHCSGGSSCTEPGAAEAAVECQALLSWLLLSLSLALPLLVEATSAARLFRQHERERAAEGLPPEAALPAAVYRGIGWLLLDEADEGPEAAAERCWPSTGPIRQGVATYLLLAAAWDAGIWIAHRAGA